MRAVTVRTSSGVLSLGYRLTVHAVDVLLDGVRNGAFVAGQEIGIAVASGADGHDLPSPQSARTRQGTATVNRPVAGCAGGGISVAPFGHAAVRAGGEIGNLLLVAFGTLRRDKFSRRSDFVHISMA